VFNEGVVTLRPYVFGFWSCGKLSLIDITFFFDNLIDFFEDFFAIFFDFLADFLDDFFADFLANFFC